MICGGKNKFRITQRRPYLIKLGNVFQFKKIIETIKIGVEMFALALGFAAHVMGDSAFSHEHSVFEEKKKNRYFSLIEMQ